MPPADDLCLVCQYNTALIMKSANLSEDEKVQRLVQAQEHLDCAKKNRDIIIGTKYLVVNWLLPSYRIPVLLAIVGPRSTSLFP